MRVRILRRSGVRCAYSARESHPRSSSRTPWLGGFRNEPIDEVYTLGDTLGSGAYGVVRAAERIDDGRAVAIKSIPKLPRRFTGKPSAYAKKLRTELEAHLSLGKASLDVCHALDAHEDDSSVHLVLERCDGGSLLSSRDVRLFPLRRDAGEGCRYSEKEVAAVLRSALRSVLQCNAAGVVFRDIKPDNFLWTREGHLKLTDFGMACFHAEGDGDLTERCGTTLYQAPEVLRQRYGKECDVWSVGVMAYLLLSGTFPFLDEEGTTTCTKEVWRAILYAKPDFDSEPWPSVSVAAKHFVQSLLEKDPRRRISAADAISHYWIREEGGVAEDGAIEAMVVSRLQRYGSYGRLRQAILRGMVAHLPPQIDAGGEVARFLDALDVDKSGMLRLEDLVWMLSSSGYDLEAREWAQIFGGVFDTGAEGGGGEGGGNSARSMEAARIHRDALAPVLVDWPRVRGKHPQVWEQSAEAMYAALCTRGERLRVEDLVDLACSPSPKGKGEGEGEGGGEGEGEDESWDEGETCSLSILDEVGRAIHRGAGADSLEYEDFLTLLGTLGGDADDLVYDTRYTEAS